MSMEMTCILCPMGCQLSVSADETGVSVSGNGCARGVKYGEQELLMPMRTVTSSVRIAGASLPLCPVKTSAQVPKAKVAQVLSAIRKIRVQAPVAVGDVLLPNVAGTGADVVATANR